MRGVEISPIKHVYLKNEDFTDRLKHSYLRNIMAYSLDKGVAFAVSAYLRDVEHNCPEPSIRIASSRKLTDANIKLICEVLDEAYEKAFQTSSKRLEGTRECLRREEQRRVVVTLPGYHDRSESGMRKLRERSLGAENRVRARRADGRVAGVVAGTDARGLTAAARLTLRGTPHTRTRAEPDTTERGSKEHCHAVTH
ncbi:hypothetical protein EVAR_102044_1 [Eumeta japonica]|uniref:Uncharacterized protein n=1 Tax=Eumeta variegata TaxID=151549 RepID=A0A4C1TZS3_EUMVA|nr:hypothetical protein EVAR_102044_1 [Eumeta japonica]